MSNFAPVLALLVVLGGGYVFMNMSGTPNNQRGGKRRTISKRKSSRKTRKH